MECKYKVILSIDGGGIRGIVPLMILRHIEKQFSVESTDFHLSNLIDVFAGTSTGAIISSALMLHDENGKPIHNVDGILNLYTSRGKQIFNKRATDPRKKSYPLKMVLENNFGSYRINELTKHFLFASYDMDAHRPFFFTNKMDQHGDVSLSKAMMACSAIPAYFPPVKLGDMELVDGILTAKNPAKYAYDYGRTHYPDEPILLISLGTGNLSHAHQDAHEAEIKLVDEQLEKLSHSTSKFIYFRFQPDLKKSNDEMDDTSQDNIQHLIDDSTSYIEEYAARFDRLFSLIRIKTKSR